jgi:hypothetical protein
MNFGDAMEGRRTLQSGYHLGRNNLGFSGQLADSHRHKAAVMTVSKASMSFGGGQISTNFTAIPCAS